MNKFSGLILLLLSFVMAPPNVQAQEKQSASQVKLVEFHMALLKRGQNGRRRECRKKLRRHM